uniref:Uncharacterized protein n=1 Tax=Zonotrichia albicollis TaxID=44394 RepID=A0A8D2MS19_ZONAL
MEERDIACLSDQTRGSVVTWVLGRPGAAFPAPLCPGRAGSSPGVTAEGAPAAPPRVGMAAGARRRQLPAWMGAAGDGRAAAAPRRWALPALSVLCALPRPAALYCMNEAELLEVALAVLAEVSRDLRGWGRQLRRTGKEALLPAAPWRPSPGGPEGAAGAAWLSRPLLSVPGTGAENSEDDVLKYVREIFFS